MIIRGMDGIIVDNVEGRDEVSRWVLDGRLATHHLESGECSRAGTELVGFQAEALEHADEQIAKRRRVVGIKGQVLAMTEATAGEQHRKVASGMTAAISQVAAEEDSGAVEK